MERKKILITGATGFIGQHLLEDLKTSDLLVYALSRKESPVFWGGNIECRVLFGDLLQVESLVNALKGIDVVINLAAEIRNDQLIKETNVDGTKNLIDAIKINKVKKVIHLSSVGVVGKQYSSTSQTVTELTKCNPQNRYERSKLESEKLLLDFKKKHSGIQLVILRPTNVFGEHNSKMVLLNLLKRLQAERKVFYSKGAVVNFLYVKDLSAAIIHFINEDINDASTYTIGSSTKMKDFLDIASDSLGKKLFTTELPSVLFRFIDVFDRIIPAFLKGKLNSLSNKVVYSDQKLSSKFIYPFGIKVGLSNTILNFKKQNLL